MDHTSIFSTIYNILLDCLMLKNKTNAEFELLTAAAEAVFPLLYTSLMFLIQLKANNIHAS